jgi:ParB family chromosome partitioning protein
VTKARILEAVREARGETAATQIADLRKPEMETAAAALLAGSGWLPDLLRTPGQPVPATVPVPVPERAEAAGGAREAEAAAA